jgi:Putative beta-barrel porin-2, OmpL-like. bbp2
VRSVLLISIGLAWRVASAQPAAPAPASDAPSFKISGYVEAFYQLNFDRPSNLVTAYRDFDDRTNSFTIDNAVLDVTGQVGAVSTRIALQVGHTASASYTAEPTYAAQAGTGASDAALWQVIQQAIVGYKVNKLQTEAGIFLSPVGLENLAIKDQWNWSRSTPFFALPYYHAGVRLTYPLSDEVTGVFYVTNGWNDVVNRNPYPCFAGVVTWTPSQTLSTSLLYFGGVEDATDAPEGQPWRHLFDATATWQATPAIALAAQADAGFEPNHFGTSRWFDGAAYVRVQPARRLYLAARVDGFHEYDSHDAAGAASRLFFPADDVGSATLTADVRPAANLSVRFELRADHASAPMYFRGQVATDPVTGADIATATSQETATLGVVTWF